MLLDNMMRLRIALSNLYCLAQWALKDKLQ